MSKGYSLGKLLFGCDMTLLINHTVDWGLISQKNQAQINKDDIHENSKIFDHDYQVGDKFMLNINSDSNVKRLIRAHLR